MNELEQIVANLQAQGVPNEKILEVIQEYQNSQQESFPAESETPEATLTPVDTVLESEDGSLEP